jgi:hypothetical protein
MSRRGHADAGEQYTSNQLRIATIVQVPLGCPR